MKYLIIFYISLTLLLSSQVSFATEMSLSDQKTCEDLLWLWFPPNTCQIPKKFGFSGEITIDDNMILEIPQNVTLTNYGTMVNLGTIKNNGIFDNNEGIINNKGLVTNNGLIKNIGGILDDYGTITGSGKITGYVFDTQENMISPLKQFKSGISVDEVRCKQDFVLIQKHDDSPACVKSTSVEELFYRGWATSDKVYPVTNPQTYLLTADEGTFEIKYSINGSVLSEITYDHDGNYLVLQLEDTIGGNLAISIPRGLIDAKIANNEDDVFFVLVDGMEIDYGASSDEKERTLTILLPRGSNTIEIIGTYLR